MRWEQVEGVFVALAAALGRPTATARSRNAAFGARTTWRRANIALSRMLPGNTMGDWPTRPAAARSWDSEPAPSRRRTQDVQPSLDGQTGREQTDQRPQQRGPSGCWRCAERPTTTLLVMHDVEEALLLGDRLCLLSNRPARVVDQRPAPFGSGRGRAVLSEPEFVRMKAAVLERVLAA